MKDKAKETVTAAADEIRQLGDFIRDQRTAGGVSLRQLAKLAGVSNPYLSQIERGLRKPSAEILQQIAKGLRISAEALYVQAGFLEQRATGAVVDAVLADEALTERQKQVLLEIYQSFRGDDGSDLEAGSGVAVSVVTAAPSDAIVSGDVADAVPGAAEPATPAPRKKAARTASGTSGAPRARAPRKAVAADPDAPHDPTT